MAGSAFAAARSWRSRAAARSRTVRVDCEGDIVTAGLVELHTDNLERHIRPRPSADWPHAAAIVAHDAELAACGITTVFDAIRVGSIEGKGGMGWARYARQLATELLSLRATDALKISHHMHLRPRSVRNSLVEELAEFGPDEPDRHPQPDGSHAGNSASSPISASTAPT